jgi:Cu/Ag efflux pump CusA
LDALNIEADKVRNELAGIDGIVDLEVESQVIMPAVQIEVDLAKAEQYGLKPGDVRRSAATLLAGLEVGTLFEEQKVFEVVVWSKPEIRNSLTSVRDLLIDTPGGGHVRLGDVANVTIGSAPNVINREAVSRRIDVGFNVGGRDLRSVMNDVETRLKNIDFQLEYHPEVLGEYAEQQAAQRRILIAGVAALIGILLLLQACFDSWRLGVLAFLALPLSLVGGVLAAYFVGGGTLTLGSLAGFLTVLGIAVRNGVMLISRYQCLENEERIPFGMELVVWGSKRQSASIVMTALTTALAMAPFVIAGNIPGHEIIYPMAVVILGGLVTSTLLNLYFIPILYLTFAKARISVKQSTIQMTDAAPLKGSIS